MTPDERTLLTRFLQDLTSARGGLKDVEASSQIDQTLRANPDAGYLLVQHAIIADQALHAAQDRIVELERQAAQAQPQHGQNPQGQGSFFGASPWGGQPQSAIPPTYPQQNQTYAPAPQGGGGMFGGLFGGGQPQQGGFGSFLRTAGTTAAGVAGGQLLFNGLENLFGGHHGMGGGFGGGFGGGYGMPVENVTINEYGGDPGYGGDGGFDNGGFDDGGYDDGGVS